MGVPLIIRTLHHATDIWSREGKHSQPTTCDFWAGLVNVSLYCYSLHVYMIIIEICNQGWLKFLTSFLPCMVIILVWIGFMDPMGLKQHAFYVYVWTGFACWQESSTIIGWNAITWCLLCTISFLLTLYLSRITPLSDFVTNNIIYSTSDKNLVLSLAEMMEDDVMNRSVLCQ